MGISFVLPDEVDLTSLGALLAGALICINGKKLVGDASGRGVFLLVGDGAPGL
jgi:hypothetical protein